MTNSHLGDWPVVLQAILDGQAEEPKMVGTLVVNRPDHPWPSEVRVSKSQEKYRVESMAGELLTVHTPDRTVVFRPGQELPDQFDHGPWGAVGTHSGAIERRDPFDWTLDDFTVPTKPPIQIQFLGLPAWEIELAPPRRKPAPLVMIVDATHGMTYAQRSLRYGDFFTWTNIHAVEELSEELFEYSGPTRRHSIDGSWFD